MSSQSTIQQSSSRSSSSSSRSSRPPVQESPEKLQLELAKLLYQFYQRIKMKVDPSKPAPLLSDIAFGLHVMKAKGEALKKQKKPCSQQCQIEYDTIAWLRNWGLMASASYSSSVEALCSKTCLLPSDLLRFQITSKQNEPAFFIAKNPFRENALIVAIRGTLTMEDALSDAAAHSTKFCGSFAHKGMVLCARNILKYLDAVLRNDTTIHVQHVTFCGHSLGGGTAIIAAYLCQEDKDWKHRFQCSTYAFCTPACVSYEIAMKMASPEMDITSVICGDDIVPRASEWSLEELLLKLLETDWKKESNKYPEAKNIRTYADAASVVEKFARNTIFSTIKNSQNPTLAGFAESYERGFTTNQLRVFPDAPMDAIPMFPGGKIYYLQKNSITKKVSFVSQPPEQFMSIFVSETMFSDHNLSMVLKNMGEIDCGCEEMSLQIKTLLKEGSHRDINSID